MQWCLWTSLFKPHLVGWWAACDPCTVLPTLFSPPASWGWVGGQARRDGKGGTSSRGLGHDLLSPIGESSLLRSTSSFYKEHIYKDVFLSLFPTRLFFIDLPSTSHSFTLFQKSTHDLLMLHIQHKKVFFSPANHHVQPKPRWSWPLSLLWKQTFQMLPGALTFFGAYLTRPLSPHVSSILSNWGEVGLCGEFHKKWSLEYCKTLISSEQGDKYSTKKSLCFLRGHRNYLLLLPLCAPNS